MAVQKYSFNGKILDLDNQEIPGAPTINKMMSDILAQNMDKEVDVVKYFDWAMQIRRSGILELDKSSADELTKLIKGQQGYGVLVRRRLLACLENPIVERTAAPGRTPEPLPSPPPTPTSLTPLLDRTENPNAEEVVPNN